MSAEQRPPGDAEATIRAIERHFRPNAPARDDGKLDILDPGGAMDRTVRAVKKLGADEYATQVGNLPPALYFEVRYREAQAEAIRLQAERGALLEKRLQTDDPEEIAAIDETLDGLSKRIRVVDREVMRYFREGSRLANERRRLMRAIEKERAAAKKRREKSSAEKTDEELDPISKAMLERDRAG